MWLLELRSKQIEDRTLGNLIIFTREYKTLELPWRNNEKNISCIPAGTYTCKSYSSSKYKDVWEVLDVPNRSKILIHIGNYPKDTHGCILVGKSHSDIDGDGIDDVSNSTKAIKELRALLPEEFTLRIIR